MTNGVPYPLRLSISRPESQSRLTNFPFLGLLIRSLLLIPHFVILWFLGIAATIVLLIATFAILFTGAFPEGMRRFVVGYLRWQTNTSAYIWHLFDDYPPFSMDHQDSYPLTLEVEAQVVSRWLNFPILGLILKSILLIPHYVILWFLGIAAAIVILIGEFGILFTGSFPVELHRFAAGVVRWTLRVTAYQFALTDAYPPFTLN